jgi:endonuclease/exonuclease/phosphatase family metal-dependent hydrolase
VGSIPLPALVAAVVCLLAAFPGGRAAAEPASALRAVTFNLLHGGPASGWRGDGAALEERLTLVRRELAGLAPDVVALQEASITGAHGHVAARLATALGLHWAHASATRRVSRIAAIDRLIVWAMNFEEGPAVLSRWPIVETEIIDLPRCARFYDPRVVLRAAVDTPRGRMQVFSTHLARDPCQVDRLVEVVRAHTGPLPALLLGDFNTPESSAEIARLVRGGRLVDAFRAANPDATGATVWQRPGAPEPTATRRVDFIFIRPGTAATARVRASRVVLATPGRLANGTALWPSDHYGVLAEIALAGHEARR